MTSAPKSGPFPKPLTSRRVHHFHCEQAGRVLRGTDTEAWAQAGLLYELSEGVAWLRLNRPERRNAMDHYSGGQGPHGMGLRDALLEAILSATEDKSVKVAVITGNGSVFSAGADLKLNLWRYRRNVVDRRRCPVTMGSSMAGIVCSSRSGAAKRRSSQLSMGRPSGRDASWRWRAT